MDAPTPTGAAWLEAEPFTLVLSAGFFGFYAHTGVLSALEGRGLRPRRIVGVSAGALAGGMWAAGIPAAELQQTLEGLRREHFWDPGFPWGGLLKGQKFKALLEGLLGPRGVSQIEETEIELALGVHDVLRFQNLLLGEGPLEAAIRASCCVPLLFRPVRIGRRILVDGGVSDRDGLRHVPAGERVLNHHLITHDGRSRPPADSAQRKSLAIPELPKLGPNALDEGLAAFSRAREVMQSWLDAPLGPPPS